jgi:phospholipid/cholesterol/gamma-HCH transport system substrate-binding protein
MVQSKSNKQEGGAVIEKEHCVALPKKNLSTEFFVGLFTMVGLLALGYQAVGLGGMEFGQSNRYEILAEFDNIAGLKKGAAVEIAGVGIGEVSKIRLKDPMALITLSIDNGVEIQDDDILSVRTKGIIGDRYIKVSRGGSQKFLKPGETVTETESAVDIEDIIGKIVHSLGGDDEKKEETPEDL